MSSWPSSLPQAPLVQGYSETFADNLLRTPMDKGPVKVRRRTTRGVKTFAITFRLTAAQAATFTTFFEDTLSDGALSFTFTQPRTGTTLTVRFVSVPSLRAERRGQFYILDATLEVLP